MSDLNDLAARGATESSAPNATDGSAPRPRDEPRAKLTLAALALVGIVAALLPPAGVPGVVVTLILFLSFPEVRTGKMRTFRRLAVLLAAAGCVVGLTRFAMSGAILGIVESGQSAAAKSALYRLREVVLAEDALRKSPRVDPDGDGVGSAALIGTLSGTAPGALGPPLLNGVFRGSVETPLGPSALVEGYLVIVCLPRRGGGFTARPGDVVDQELAERRYLAYAWPSETASGMNTVFFTDEHENIRVLDLPRGEEPPYSGPARPPACDAALGEDHLPWRAWKNKKPRSTLPGDRP